MKPQKYQLQYQVPPSSDYVGIIVCVRLSLELNGISSRNTKETRGSTIVILRKESSSVV